ncbi:MAG: hypothetical protein H3C35_10125 [Bacteroidetes bacterium]|nr:hypothetical protein [Bacteroidota bacterium]
MKTKILLLIILLVFSLPILAQDKSDDDNDWERTTKIKVGGAGGVTPIAAFFNNNELDKSLKAVGLPALGSDPIYLVGGEGYGYIMFLKNVRMGGGAVSGSKTVSAIQNLGGGVSMKKDVEYSVSYGGFLIDYVLPIQDRLDIAAGFTIGGGNINLKMTRDDNSLKVWDSVWNDYGNINSQTRNYTRNLNGSFGVFNPHINIEYAILRWLQLRVGVGYPIMYSPEWTFDEKFTLNSVPSKVKTNGYTINAGIMFGFFN